MNFLVTGLLYVIPFLLVIGLVITVHELGHFLAGRAVGAKVERFAIGFGRGLASWRDKSGCEYRLGWIPIGGYVRFAGDENMASIPDAESLAELRQHLLAKGEGAALSSYFHFKPLWQRTIIIAAGPLANFLLAIAIFAGLLMVIGEPIGTTRVDGVKPGSPAAEAGLRVGDMIVSVDGRKLRSFDDLTDKVILSSDTPMTLVVKRGDQELSIVATPRRATIYDRLGKPQRLGQLGVTHDRSAETQYQRYNLPDAVVRGAQRCMDTVGTTIKYIGRIFTGRENADQLAGPLGMAQLSGDLAKEAAKASPDVATFLVNFLLFMVQFAGVISVGIGFMNLLPIPVLDGGHLIFYAYEAVARRPLAAKVQAAGYRVGLALVLGLMLFATWNDLQRLHVFNLFNRLNS
jgi:regulator of sigma E protease